MLNRIVVVGAAAAGLTAVETLRAKGYEGGLTLVGDEVHPPYDRPPLSKELLSEGWEPPSAWLRKEDVLAAVDVDLRLGCRATGLDQPPGPSASPPASGCPMTRRSSRRDSGRAGCRTGTASGASMSCVHWTTQSGCARRSRQAPGWR